MNMEIYEVRSHHREGWFSSQIRGVEGEGSIKLLPYATLPTFPPHPPTQSFLGFQISHGAVMKLE